MTAGPMKVMLIQKKRNEFQRHSTFALAVPLGQGFFVSRTASKPTPAPAQGPGPVPR
jgi:hypothetical protein